MTKNEALIEAQELIDLYEGGMGAYPGPDLKKLRVRLSVSQGQIAKYVTGRTFSTPDGKDAPVSQAYVSKAEVGRETRFDIPQLRQYAAALMAHGAIREGRLIRRASPRKSA